MVSELGRKIHELRLSRKLSLTELANRSGIAKSYVSYIERNDHANPSVDVLERICNALEVDVDLILQPEGEDTPELDWLSLIRRAQSSGITKQHFLEFIQQYISGRQ